MRYCWPKTDGEDGPTAKQQTLLVGLLAVGAAACVLTGALPGPEFAALMNRIGPLMVFVTAMTVVSYLADAAGLFRVVTAFAAKLGCGRTLWLWFLVLALTTGASVFLSLDTAVVLVTPLVISLAGSAGIRPIVFALSTVWLANTASLLLPVSNLTNLLAQQKSGIHPLEYAALLWLPSLAGILVPVLLLWLVFRHELSGRYAAPAGINSDDVPDRGLLRLSMAVMGLLLPALVSGIQVAVPATAAALVLAAAFLLRMPRAFKTDMLPVLPVILAVSLFIVVQTAHSHGLGALLGQAAGSGEGFRDLLRLAGAGAAASNAVNNLPAYLALEPAAETPVRLGALLIGVNLGAVVTPWGSLATLLWYDRMRTQRLRVRWGRFMLAGLVAATGTTAAATAALAFLR